MRAVRWAGALLCVGLLVAAPLRAARPGAAGATVAVLPFRDLGGGAGAIGEALRETVTADLKELSGLRVVERADLDRILAEQQLQARRADLEPATAARVGRLLGATLIVTGASRRAPAAVRLTARVVRVESGEILGTAKVDGQEAELLRLLDRITAALLRSAGLGEHARRLGRSWPALEGLQAVELYGQAVQEPDDLQRLRLLRLAAATDSAFAYAVSDLKAPEQRLRAYQQGDAAARDAAIQDRTARLQCEQDPAAKGRLLAEQLTGLQQAGRYRQITALARQAGAGLELPAFYLVLAALKLRDRQVVLRDGEEFLRRYPGSAYFPAVKSMVEQTVAELRRIEEGRSKAEADRAPAPLRWDLCHLALLYRGHGQHPEEQRLLHACLAVGRRPRAEVLPSLVAADLACGDFAAARRDLAALEQAEPDAARSARLALEIPADG